MRIARPLFMFLCGAILCLHASTGLAGNVVTPKIDTTVTSSATLISATNASRDYLNCTNTSASVHVRWGDALTTASTGQQLRAGTAIAIASTAAIYMISEGANVTVSCTEETK